MLKKQIYALLTNYLQILYSVFMIESFFIPMILIICCVVLGVFASKLPFFPKPKILDFCIRLVLLALLFCMGLRLGFDITARNNIGKFGLLAFIFAFFTCLGSALFTIIYIKIFSFFRNSRNQTINIKPIHTKSSKEKLSAIIKRITAPIPLLSAAILGYFTAIFLPFKIDAGTISTYVLYILLLLIGAQMAQQKVPFKKLFLQPQLLILPVCTILGTWFGAIILTPFIKMEVNSALAVSSGFGWYSLSGVLLTNQGDAGLGAISFLTNLFRESIAILIIPLFAGTKIKEAAISISGATSMDTTLPLIEKNIGSEYVLEAFFHGALLSFLVPILVPLLYLMK